MKRMKDFANKVRGEHGITGLETAIVLIAFVVVAAVFAFVVLSTGLFSSERGKETVYAGLAKTRGSMELTGGVIASSNTTKLTAITFDLTLAAGGDQVNLNPTDTTNRTVISYQDNDNKVNDVVYTTTVITGGAGDLLEQGELFEINIDLTQTALTAVNLTTNQTFTFEVKPPSGSYLVIQRTTPASIAQSVINLN
ncbi:MAG: flagellin [Dehalococcoidia bacterium]|nr:MAG: flagellin [Dehalococcoidia bacterium]